jgi:hypothetical protein
MNLRELIEQEGATRFLVKIWVVLVHVEAFCPLLRVRVHRDFAEIE